MCLYKTSKSTWKRSLNGCNVLQGFKTNSRLIMILCDESRYMRFLRIYYSLFVLVWIFLGAELLWDYTFVRRSELT